MDPTEAPDDVPLALVERGWLVFRAEGKGPEAMLGRESWVDWISRIGRDGAMGGHAGLPVSLAERRFQRAQRAAFPLSAGAVGRAVAVTGRVAPGPTFETPDGRLAVLAVCYGASAPLRGSLVEPLPEPLVEVRAIDFALAVGGVVLQVAARHARLLDPSYVMPPSMIGEHARPDRKIEPIARAVRQVPGGTVTDVLWDEVSIGPGDEVEVVGVLTSDVDPDGERASLREPPMRTGLRGTRRRPLLIRSR